MVTTFAPHMAQLAGLVPWAVSGGQDDPAVGLAVIFEIGADDLEGGPFTVRAGGGLEGDLIEAGDFLEEDAQVIEQRQHALAVGGFLEGVEVGEAVPARRPIR